MQRQDTYDAALDHPPVGRDRARGRSSTLTAVGTTDASDSGLMQDVIQPAFNKAYPQFTFKYIGTATGAASTHHRTGVEGAVLDLGDLTRRDW